MRLSRRAFCKNLMLFTVAGAVPLKGCGEGGQMQQTIEVAPFSRARLHAQLDALQAAFETKGHQVSASLLPALQEPELRARCSWFPEPLPEELLALYAWRGGQAKDAWDEPFPFWFRDCAFVSPERAAQEYASMMASYGQFADVKGLLASCFPFAAFNGGWLVLPCKRQTLDKRLERPVISVFQGIDVHFHSLQLMVDTCVDWVSHPQYDTQDAALPEPLEMEIWRRHNPGIFEPA